MSDSFYRTLDEARFVATEHTRGPWSPAHQHGGPPSALLGHCLERAVGPELACARFTLELLKPVPIAELAVRTHQEHASRSVQRWHATLHFEEQVVARASALFLARQELKASAVDDEEPRHLEPELCEPLVFPFFLDPIGYHTAVEVRIARGEFGSGKVAAWMRPRLPLLDDAPLSALSRLLLVADSASGVSARLDTNEFSFINPEVTLFIHRYPTGSWVLLDAQTSVQGDGVGLTEARYHDEAGSLGSGAQPLLVRRR